ncbi:MAG: prepilin-type N-terminal cleavage/methylation domain-containing protein [Betaproteobacteria bacterium]|nr:prepilin-type N-terminal cleavage/methylation domain-containing protein [Betaproteobacteria bacterium]
MNQRRRSARGVSLVEALVALAVMAFGMLGLIGVQSTLRLNGDTAKQRSEAVRIAQSRLDDLRAFSVLPVTAGASAYADIVSAGPVSIERHKCHVPTHRHRHRINRSWRAFTHVDSRS